jgi:hypothetical protein
MTPAEKEARMSSLVSALPIEEWGKKPNPPKQAVPAATSSATKQAGSAVDTPTPSKAKMPSLFKQDFDGVESDSDSDDDEGDDTELPAAGSLGRKIAQMRWADGAPRIEEIPEEDKDQDMESDIRARSDEGDEEDRLDRKREASLRWDDNIDEAMRKRVWGTDGTGAVSGREKKEERPVVVNADEADGEDGEGEGMDVDMVNEMNDFLSFARETLGVGEEQWNGILQSRQDRGGESEHCLWCRPAWVTNICSIRSF